MNLIPHVKLTDKTEISVKKQQQSEFTMLGSIVLKPGLKLWQFNYSTMEIKLAEIKDDKTVDFETAKRVKNKNVIVDTKVRYFQALNAKNAVKKVNKIIFEAAGIKNYFSYKNKQIISNY
jgi:hypothetical protein